MERKIMELHPEKSNELYASTDCQLLLNTYEEYYKLVGFNLPWVGYFVVRQNIVVGSCGFTGQPKYGNYHGENCTLT